MGTSYSLRNRDAGFVIELVGISFTDETLAPLISPAPLGWQALGIAGVAISFVAPFCSITALKMAFGGNAKSTDQVRPKREAVPLLKINSNKLRDGAIWIILSLTILISLLECFWTISGHPTWYQGFAG